MIPVSIAAAVNDEKVLQSCLLRSPDIGRFSSSHFQRGFPSASSAYNKVLKSNPANTVAFVHQDVYLPPGWFDSFQSSLAWLEKYCPNWGVLGLYGKTKSGRGCGHLYSTGLGSFVGRPFEEPQEVRTLDEVMLVLNSGRGLTFDERLTGFHMYGTDICLEAERRALPTYVFPAFAVHNSNGYARLPWEFWKGYLFLRRKWRHYLPIVTPCTRITFSCWSLCRATVLSSLAGCLRPTKTGCRVADPASLFKSIACEMNLKSR